MEHLQSVLKEIDSVAIFIDNFVIQYFSDSPNPAIRVQLDESDCNWNN